MYQYPYGNAQQLNLDWLMEQWQEVKQSIDGSLQGEIDRVEAAITDLLAARDAAVAAAGAANTSAGAAAASAQAAAADAATATAQAAAATQERVNAAQAANNAQAYAGTAQTQAAAAQNAAGQAAASASQAAADASDAHDDALSASGSAVNAAASAAGALQNFQLSDAARQAAQAAAQDAAQDAQDAEAAATLLQPPATSADIGKALIVKTVGGGTVTAYELGESGGGGGGTPAIVNTIEDVPIASFDDGTVNPVQQLIVDIEPVQAGSGDPAPDNVRPITGWAGANVYRAGKNILPVTAYSGVGYNAAIGTEFSMTLQPNVTFQNGILKRTNVDAWGRMCLLTPILPIGSYVVTGELQTNGIVVQIITLDINKKLKRIVSQANSSATSYVINNTVTLQDDEKYISLYVASNQQSAEMLLIHPQIEYSSIATSYEDSAITTYQVQFPTEAGTVYGGTLDITNGMLTVDTLFVELDGTESGWTKYSTNQIINNNLFVGTETSGSYFKGLCSHIPSNSDGMIDTSLVVHVNNSRGIQFRNLNYFGLTDNEVSTWTSYLAAQAQNGTPLQIIAYLQTPVEYTITTADVIQLLAGYNNVWADTGNIKLLQYYADSKKYIDEQDALIKALIAPVLDGMIADTALTANDFRIVDNTLYRITAPVAAGAALTPNTNCTASTIGAILKTLLT